MEADYDYYANGQTKKVTYGNGMVTAYTYDDAGRLANIMTKHGFTKGAPELLVLSYLYNSRDLVVDVFEAGSTIGLAGQPIHYDYDDRGRKKGCQEGMALPLFLSRERGCVSTDAQSGGAGPSVLCRPGRRY